MLKSALKTEIATELDDPNNTDFTDLVGEWIDDVIQDIAIRFDWEFLRVSKEKTLSANSYTVTVSNVVNIAGIQIKDTEDYLTKATKEQLMEGAVDFEASGEPVFWFVDSFDQSSQDYIIRFDSAPSENTDLLIQCTKELGEIDNSEHIPLPNDAISIVKNGVRAYFYDHEEQFNSSDRYARRYERGVAYLIRTHGEMIAERTISPTESDLNIFGGGEWDPNLRLDVRSIPDPDA